MEFLLLHKPQPRINFRKDAGKPAEQTHLEEMPLLDLHLAEPFSRVAPSLPKEPREFKRCGQTAFV